MKTECGIARDLIPLCVEQMESPESADYVRSHLAECESCKTYFDELRRTAPVPVPVETDLTPLKQLHKGLHLRMGLAALMALLLVLTVAAGIFICGLIPVWLSADEAVLDVSATPSGQVQVLLSEDTYGIVHCSNGFYYYGLRLDFLRPAKQERKMASFRLEEGGSLWYLGAFTGQENTLLWGDGKQQPEQPVTAADIDRTVQYLFWCSLTAGFVIATLGILLRKKKLGSFLMAFGSFFLCGAAACLFVTGGHLLVENPDSFLGIPMLVAKHTMRFVSIGVMTVLSWGTIHAGRLLIHLGRK